MTPWLSPEFDDHEQVCAFSDAATGLRAIVAIHNTVRGPAIGGTRFLHYAEDRLALDDALRLSRAMSYKCALAGVNAGGGKAVVIGDPALLKTRDLLHAYGRMLNRIGSSFATGEDVGMAVADVETMREVSPYVGGTASVGAGDPSVHTAKGVFAGLRAVLATRFGGAGFSGVRIAVQGLGNVGWRLCELLHQAGATLIVADVDQVRVDRATVQFGATAASTETIHAAAVDIFAPCALGGVVNAATLGEIKAQAVAGAANNQLAAPEFGGALHERGILFAPDFVMNAGGVIGSIRELNTIPGRTPMDVEDTNAALDRIHDRLIEIFARSRDERRPPEAVALDLARALIGR